MLPVGFSFVCPAGDALTIWLGPLRRRAHVPREWQLIPRTKGSQRCWNIWGPVLLIGVHVYWTCVVLPVCSSHEWWKYARKVFRVPLCGDAGGGLYIPCYSVWSPGGCCRMPFRICGDHRSNKIAVWLNVNYIFLQNFESAFPFQMRAESYSTWMVSMMMFERPR